MSRMTNTCFMTHAFLCATHPYISHKLIFCDFMDSFKPSLHISFILEFTFFMHSSNIIEKTNRKQANLIKTQKSSQKNECR